MSVQIDNSCMRYLSFHLIEGYSDIVIVFVEKVKICPIGHLGFDIEDRRSQIIRIVSLSMRPCEEWLYFFVHVFQIPTEKNLKI